MLQRPSGLNCGYSGCFAPAYIITARRPGLNFTVSSALIYFFVNIVKWITQLTFSIVFKLYKTINLLLSSTWVTVQCRRPLGCCPSPTWVTVQSRRPLGCCPSPTWVTVQCRRPLGCCPSPTWVTVQCRRPLGCCPSLARVTVQCRRPLDCCPSPTWVTVQCRRPLGCCPSLARVTVQCRRPLGFCPSLARVTVQCRRPLDYRPSNAPAWRVRDKQSLQWDYNSEVTKHPCGLLASHAAGVARIHQCVCVYVDKVLLIHSCFSYSVHIYHFIIYIRLSYSCYVYLDVHRSFHRISQDQYANLINIKVCIYCLVPFFLYL